MDRKLAFLSIQTNRKPPSI